MDDNDEIWFGANGNAVPSRKTFLCDLKNSGVVPHTIITYEEGGHNHEAVQELKNLLNGNVFNNPKPTKLICVLLHLANLNSDSLVLDFFSGSATTANSVMKFNAEMKYNCKFLLVQLPEQIAEKTEAHKVGYNTICEIGEERIRCAGRTLRNNQSEATGDIGFRVFRVDSTNMKEVYYGADDYNQSQIDMFADNIKEERTTEDLLIQVMLDLGVSLSSKIDETMIDNKKVFVVGGEYTDKDGYIHTHLIACFDKEITDDTVKAIALKHPSYAIFRDSSMATDSVATNFDQIFQTFSPDTVRKVL